MLLAQSDIENAFGKVSPPPGVVDFNTAAGGADKIGLLVFISHVIQVATIIAGMWVLFNFITAGYIYITSAGESSSHNKVKDQLTNSVLGLVIIVAAYTLIAILSFLLFGRADYILNPQLSGPTGP